MNTRRASLLGVLVALALALHVLEAQIPSPLPWVRPGLANLLTLIALLTLGWRAGLTVTLVRVVLGALLLGGFLGPAFVLSLAGGLSATLVMAVLARGAWRLWSPLAVSAAGAVAHGLAQVFAVSALLQVHPGDLARLLPWVLAPALLSGIATGVLANLVLLRWPAHFRTVA